MTENRDQLIDQNFSGRLDSLNAAVAALLDMLPPEKMAAVLHHVHSTARAAAGVAEADDTNYSAAAYADGMISQIRRLHQAIETSSLAPTE